MLFNSCATVYRAIEASQGIFKFNNSRLTLRDPKSRPFASMGKSEIDDFLTEMISRVGLCVSEIALPGQPGSKSSKFSTFYVKEPDETKKFPIIFGYAFSAAEEIQITEIKRSLSHLLSQGQTVKLWNGREHIIVNDVIRKGGSREKADAVLGFDGKPMISVSLKHLKTGRATQMQGWAGLTGKMGVKEVIDFADSIWKTGASRAWRSIKSKDLKMESCWGVGSDCVDIIAAGGGLSLIDDGMGGHKITADKIGGIWYAADGKAPDGDFDPVLFCRPSSNHSITTSHGVLKGIRMMVAPCAVACGSATEI